MYTGTTSIPYTKVTSIHYQTLSKKDITWKIDVNKLSVWSLQGLLLQFLDKHDDFVDKNEEFYNPSVKNILVTINGVPNQLFATELQAREIYPELSKYFYKENTYVTWEDFLTTKFAYGLIHVRTLITHFMAAAEQWKKVVYCFRSKKHLKPVVILCAMCLALKIQ